jgi:hypothetical protein
MSLSLSGGCSNKFIKLLSQRFSLYEDFAWVIRGFD